MKWWLYMSSILLTIRFLCDNATILMIVLHAHIWLELVQSVYIVNRHVNYTFLCVANVWMNDHDVLGISRRLLKFIRWELSSFGDPQFFGQNIKKKLESTEYFACGCVFWYKMAAAVKANVVANCCWWCGHHFIKPSERTHCSWQNFWIHKVDTRTRLWII